MKGPGCRSVCYRVLRYDPESCLRLVAVVLSSVSREQQVEFCSSPSVRLVQQHFEHKSWQLLSWNMLLVVEELGWKDSCRMAEVAVVIAVAIAVAAVAVVAAAAAV